MTKTNILTVLDFAKKYDVTTITVELDEGDMNLTPDEASEVFEALAPGEAFEILSINF